MTFAEDTAVTRVAPGSFTAELHERWSSLVGIHGGYTAAIVANAMTAAVDDPSRALRSFATQFASIPRPGPVDIDVTVERTGKSMTTTSARLRQEGSVLQVAHAASSTTRPGLTYDDHVRPREADPGDTPLFTSSGGVGHFQNADVRLDPDTVLFGGGHEAHVAAWLRPLGGEPVTAAWLVAMCDLLPPAVFSRTTGPVAAATIEYVVHLATGDPSVPAAGTSTSPAAHRCRTKGSPSKTPPCGGPTVESSPSPVRPASPEPELYGPTAYDTVRRSARADGHGGSGSCVRGTVSTLSAHCVELRPPGWSVWTLRSLVTADRPMPHALSRWRHGFESRCGCARIGLLPRKWWAGGRCGGRCAPCRARRRR